MENQRNQMAIVTIQKALSNYIEFKKDEKKFTKYLEKLNVRTDKKDSKKST